MQSGLIHERRPVEVSYFYERPNGSVVCKDCTPLHKFQELEFAEGEILETPCDCCNQRIGDVKVRTHANVTIEYVPCKIF